jgi:hypothetical protein
LTHADDLADRLEHNYHPARRPPAPRVESLSVTRCEQESTSKPPEFEHGALRTRGLAADGSARLGAGSKK